MKRTGVKNTTVCKLDKQIAVPFIEKWHYSNRVPTGKNVFFGWLVFAEDEMPVDTIFNQVVYAVADYGIGVNAYQAAFLARKTGKEVNNTNLMELKRLCRIEPKLDKYPLTAFISRCHKVLKLSGVNFIVSFSDPAYNHTGGIYKAANFTHMGQTNAEWHLIDEDGVMRHRRYAYRYAQRNGMTTSRAREVLGLKRIQTPPKDRWFIAL